ncbi:MAG: hypothetical protein BRC26_01945, partial [Nanohaloarchaea archaeon QH_8_44_6]
MIQYLNTADPLTQVGLALLILVFGHLGVKLLGSIIRRLWTSNKDDLTRKEIQERNEALNYFTYALDAGIIIVALLYLNTDVDSGMVQSLVEFLPQMVSAILVVILGFLAINISTKIGSDFMKTVGVQSYF